MEMGHETILEMLRARADGMGDAEESTPGCDAAAQYSMLLEACQAVLGTAPTSPAECTEEHIEQCLIDALVCVATTLASVLPGGLREMRSYLSEEQRATWGQQCPHPHRS